MKKFISTLLIATSVSQISAAQTAQPTAETKDSVEITLTGTVDEAVAPAGDTSPAALVRSLRSFELPMKGQFATQDQGRDYMKSVLDQLRIQDLPGTEGVSRIELPDNPVPLQFNTGRVILEALKKAETLPMGQKIRHYDSAVKKVLRTSFKRDGERTARMTLNRAFDVVNTVLAMTNTPEAHALYAANLYETAFQLALSQVNSDVSIYKVVDIEKETKKVLFLGDYGVMFSKLMESYMSHANITNAHRAVMVIKALGYLAWDLRLDVRGMNNRSESVSNVLVKIYELQKEDPDMQGLLAALERGNEPNLASLRRVADQVSTVIAEAPEALKAANSELSIR